MVSFLGKKCRTEQNGSKIPPSQLMFYGFGREREEDAVRAKYITPQEFRVVFQPEDIVPQLGATLAGSVLVLPSPTARFTLPQSMINHHYLFVVPATANTW